MRRVLLSSAFCLAAVGISACVPESVIPTENIPTAGVRFINAVPDTSGAFGLDFRWVDQVENNAHYRMTYRNGPGTTGGATNSTLVQFKPVRAGSRHFRIFLDDTIPAFAQIVLKDSTVILEAGKNYTAILWGYARTGSVPAMKLTFYEEVVPDPAANVALRVINATGAAIEVRHYADGGTAPGLATMPIIPALSVGTYVTDAPGLKRLNIQPAGGGTTLFAPPLMMVGTAASSTAGPLGRLDIEAIPGTTIAGSAVTFVVYPPSVVGARTPQTATFLVTAGLSVWDRRPPYQNP